LGKYEAVTGKQFTQAAMNRNFAALKAKKEALGVVVNGAKEGAAIATS